MKKFVAEAMRLSDEFSNVRITPNAWAASEEERWSVELDVWADGWSSPVLAYGRTPLEAIRAARRMAKDREKERRP